MQQFARAEIRLDLLGIQFGRGLIGNQNHHYVGPLGGFADGRDFEARLLCLGDRLGARGEAHFYLNARVLEVESVGMSLRAVADNGHLLRLNKGKISIVIVVGLCHLFRSSFWESWLRFVTSFKVSSLCRCDPERRICGSPTPNLTPAQPPRLPQLREPGFRLRPTRFL